MSFYKTQLEHIFCRDKFVKVTTKTFFDVILFDGIEYKVYIFRITSLLIKDE